MWLSACFRQGSVGCIPETGAPTPTRPASALPYFQLPTLPLPHTHTHATPPSKQVARTDARKPNEANLSTTTMNTVNNQQTFEEGQHHKKIRADIEKECTGAKYNDSKT